MTNVTRSRLVGRTCLLAVALVAGGRVVAQGAASVTLEKAALAAEVKNDQKVVLSPGTGKRFLWVTASFSGAPQAVDLTKIFLAAGPDKVLPLLGVDSVWGGDPTQFSMIARASSKDGRALEPLEETRSTGDVGFAFTPGKIARLDVLKPPQKVCLLFLVPETFRTGEIAGFGAKALPLPPLAAGAKP